MYDEGVSREVEIANFVATLNEVFVCFNKTDGTIVFSPGFRRDYFAERFELFKILAQRLTLEDFIEEENQGMTLYLLTQTIESGFNTHIYENGHGVKSLDRFVRDLVEGEKYYFGGAVGFHYQ